MVTLKIFLIGLVSIAFDYKGTLTVVLPNEQDHEHVEHVHHALVAWQLAPDGQPGSYATFPLAGAEIVIDGLPSGSIGGVPAKSDDWPCVEFGSGSPFPADISDLGGIRWILRPGCFADKSKKMKPEYLQSKSGALVAGRLTLSSRQVAVKTARVASVGGFAPAMIVSEAGDLKNFLGYQAASDVVVLEAKVRDSVRVQVKKFGSGGNAIDVEIPTVLLDGTTSEKTILLANIPMNGDQDLCKHFDTRCLSQTNAHFELFQKLKNDSAAPLLQIAGWTQMNLQNFNPELSRSIVRLEEIAPNTGGANRPICMVTAYDAP